MEDIIKIGLSVLSIILIPALGYYLRAEIKMNSSAVKEWTNLELGKIYESIKKEVAYIEARFSELDREQTEIQASREIINLRIQHIDEKISTVDKKMDALSAKVDKVLEK
jgi:chromosome segregation ATPase